MSKRENKRIRQLERRLAVQAKPKTIREKIAGILTGKK